MLGLHHHATVSNTGYNVKFYWEMVGAVIAVSGPCCRKSFHYEPRSRTRDGHLTCRLTSNIRLWMKRLEVALHSAPRAENKSKQRSQTESHGVWLCGVARHWFSTTLCHISVTFLFTGHGKYCGCVTRNRSNLRRWGVLTLDVSGGEVDVLLCKVYVSGHCPPLSSCTGLMLHLLPLLINLCLAWPIHHVLYRRLQNNYTAGIKLQSCRHIK